MSEPASVDLSVMIPNYNYARYIGETIESVLDQDAPGIEVVVADNASTDNSVEVVRGYRDPRVRLSVNACNVGFSANLERVAAMASGRRMLLLSSDDRMMPGAAAAYRRLELALGPAAERAIFGAVSTTIDAQGTVTGELLPDPKLWRDAQVDDALSRAVGFQVRGIPASALLKRSLELLRSPLAFATTCYPRALHDAVGGYAGGRVINPDKWFLWKVMSVADMVYVIDHPLFEYRIHDAGQGPQEARSGALKHLTDEYVATFNLPDTVLEKAGLEREDLAAAFIEQDVGLRGLLSTARGNRAAARRAVHFGLATYPTLTRSNPKVWLLRGLLALGPAGTKMAQLLQIAVEKRWRARESTLSKTA